MNAGCELVATYHVPAGDRIASELVLPPHGQEFRRGASARLWLSNRAPSVKFFLAKQISARAAALSWRELAERWAQPRCRRSEGPRVGAAVQAAPTMGYRSAGKVPTPQPLGEGLHRHQYPAVVRVACVGRDVCRVHGCLRGRHGAAAGWVFEGVAFQCAHRGLRAAATKQAEWPGPRPGRDVSRHPKRGCETTAAQHTAQSLQRRRDGITPARRLPG